MDTETNRLEGKVAFVEHIVTDQGNGSSYCGNCGTYLGSNPLMVYKACFKCDYVLVDGEGHTFVSSGGSDF